MGLLQGESLAQKDILLELNFPTIEAALLWPLAIGQMCLCGQAWCEKPEATMEQIQARPLEYQIVLSGILRKFCTYILIFYKKKIQLYPVPENSKLLHRGA